MATRDVPATSGRRKPPRHGRLPRRRPALRAIGIAVFAVLVAGASLTASVAQRLQGNVNRMDITGLVAPPSPRTSAASGVDDPNARRALNILLLGSDDRSGANEAIGGANAGMRSDTAIVMHVSADRTRVELVSIPRDSLVDIPACTMTDHRTTSPRHGHMFNEAFAIGWDTGGDIASAAACTVGTVQATTGLTVDHVVVADFAGFQKVVEAVGGVEVCVPKASTDAETGLTLHAGLNALDAVDAMKFARERYETGSDGSDLTRIGHQQQLLAALAHKVLSRSVLTDPAKLLTFADAATRSLTTDSRLTPATVTGLAYSLRGTATANIVFVTVPTVAAPQDRDRVVWTSAADRIWTAMGADTPIVDALAVRASAGAGSAPPGTAGPGATPAGPGPTGGPTPGASGGPTSAPPLPAGVSSVDTVQQQASTICGA